MVGFIRANSTKVGKKRVTLTLLAHAESPGDKDKLTYRRKTSLSSAFIRASNYVCACLSRLATESAMAILREDTRVHPLRDLCVLSRHEKRNTIRECKQ